MSVQVIPGGRISFDWATVRAYIDPYDETMIIKVRLGRDVGGTVYWMSEVEAYVVPANPTSATEAKAWFSFTDLIPNTKYVYEFFVEGKPRLKSSTTIKTRKVPVFVPTLDFPDLYSLNGRYVKARYADGAERCCIILDEIFMHEISPALASELMLKITSYITSPPSVLLLEPEDLPASISSELVEDLALAEGEFHIKKVSTFPEDEAYLFEMNIDSPAGIPGLYFRQASWINLVPLGSGYNECCLDLSNPTIPIISPKELEDIDDGGITLVYET